MYTAKIEILVCVIINKRTYIPQSMVLGVSNIKNILLCIISKSLQKKKNTIVVWTPIEKQLLQKMRLSYIPEDD